MKEIKTTLTPVEMDADDKKQAFKEGGMDNTIKLENSEPAIDGSIDTHKKSVETEQPQPSKK